MFEKTDYNIFFEFINEYAGKGFMGITNQDHFMIRLNRILDSRRQFFYIGDLIEFKILYTSPQALDITGIAPENFDLSYNFKYTHPLDIERRSRIRANVIETGQEIYISKLKNKIISSNFRMRKVSGEYANVLVQCLLFYRISPIDTVYIILISTPVDWLLKNYKKGYYHWYAGSDMDYFRYPDEDLILSGSSLSERELEILMYINKGMSSKEISKKLYLSSLTINTHRRNILKKSGKSTIGEVVYDLKNIGII